MRTPTWTPTSSRAKTRTWAAVIESILALLEIVDKGKIIPGVDKVILQIFSSRDTLDTLDTLDTIDLRNSRFSDIFYTCNSITEDGHMNGRYLLRNITWRTTSRRGCILAIVPDMDTPTR